MRVLSLNCWKDEGDLERRLAVMADALQELRPDVICLQEVYASETLCVARRLSEATGLNRLSHLSRVKQRHGVGSASGLAILTPWRFRCAEALALPQLPADGERIAQLADIETPAGAVRVLNLHLTHLRSDEGSALRGEQLRGALAWAQRGCASPLIVAGDFNDSPMAVEMQGVLAAAGADFGKRAWAALAPTHMVNAIALDHVCVIDPSGAWRIASRENVLGRPSLRHGVRASDHDGVLAEITISLTNCG